ncbi:MAG TPA: protein kinase, partial [Archangium sp.]|nr:protein kinase [Archangium sp.]
GRAHAAKKARARPVTGGVMLRCLTPEVVRMEQAAVGSTEQRRQALARWRWRQVRNWLCREGAQEEFLPKEGEVVGGFTLEARLGAGSYGTVFRARRGEKLYALKLLYLPHAGAWAWRELEVLLRLHQARLVEVDCHGHYGEHPEAGPLFLYLVTPYVPGLPMDTYVERHNPGAAWAARAALALARQLVVAHSVGVVHRDLKPDNVVVEEDGHAVLVDYGGGHLSGRPPGVRGQAAQHCPAACPGGVALPTRAQGPHGVRGERPGRPVGAGRGAVLAADGHLALRG